MAKGMDNSVNKEKWYIPVNIGQHIDRDNIHEEILSKTQGRTIFQTETLFTQSFRKQIEGERDLWLKKNNETYKARFKDHKRFQPDKTHEVSVDVHEFSKKNVRLDVSFVYGYSRWHQYHILLRAFRIERDDHIDAVFRLKELESRYTFTFKGVGHGTTSTELEKILGNNYFEYRGQSPQFRNIYYRQHDIEVVIQDDLVKYLCKGRPGWMDSNSIQEP